MLFKISNQFKTTLAAPLTDGQSTLSLMNTTHFQILKKDQVMPLILNDAQTGTFFEIVYATAIAGNQLTVIRACEGAAAQAWQVNDVIFCAPTAQTIALANGSPEQTFAVHDPVNPFDAVNLQTANKTFAPLDSPTFTGNPQRPRRRLVIIPASLPLPLSSPRQSNH